MVGAGWIETVAAPASALPPFAGMTRIRFGGSPRQRPLSPLEQDDFDGTV